MWAILERLAACNQLLDYLYYILVELSSFAVGFHELVDSKNVSHPLVACSQWPHIHFCYISIRYLIGPICGVVCSGLRCREHYLFFVLKGLLGFLYQAATRQSLPICYWGYSRFNLSQGLYSSSLCIALSRSPLRTHLTWISLYVVTFTLPQLVKLSGGGPLTCYKRFIPCPRSLLSGVSWQSLNDKSN